MLHWFSFGGASKKRVLQRLNPGFQVGTTHLCLTVGTKSRVGVEYYSNCSEQTEAAVTRGDESQLADYYVDNSIGSIDG